MGVARDNILQRIAQYEGDGIEYSLMSLCKSPLSTIQQELAGTIKSTLAVEQALSVVIPDWKAFVEVDETKQNIDLNKSFGIPQHLIDNATLSESTSKKLSEGGSDPGVLLTLRKSLVGDQTKMRAAYVQEVAEVEREDEQAERRKHDYTPLIYNSIKMLADGELKDIVMDTRGD
jgi:ubiquitin carboxyl-terminal hydrolase L5